MDKHGSFQVSASENTVLLLCKCKLATPQLNKKTPGFPVKYREQFKIGLMP